MKLSELEAQVLKLGPAERARLATRLLESLEALSDDENERLWVEESLRRDADLAGSPKRGRPAAQVFREARTKLR